MTNEEAIKILSGAIKQPNPKDGYMGQALTMAIEALEQTRWIPVSERLPESNRLVLCYITTGASRTYFLALWNDIQNAWEEGIGGSRLLENDLGYEVIAWMYLPEAYTESEE